MLYYIIFSYLFTSIIQQVKNNETLLISPPLNVNYRIQIRFFKWFSEVNNI